VLHQRAALVEVEAPLAGFHEFERRAAHEDELGLCAGIATGGPGKLCRVVAIEEDERSPQRHGIERIDPRACGNDDPALVVGNVALDGDRRIETPAAQLPRRALIARDRLRPVDPGDRPPLQLLIERAVSPVFSSWVSRAWICSSRSGSITGQTVPCWP
jgi:hypothetical protein